MPLTRAKKEVVVADVIELIGQSKMTVVASYQGTSVKDMQALRNQAKENGTTIKVIKNRLVLQALKSLDSFKEADRSHLSGMLTYAFNSNDEVAPAQSLANFAKTNPSLVFIGAFTADAKWLDAQQVSHLAELPSKPVLIASVVSLLGSPLRSVISSVNKSLPDVLSALQTRTN